MQSNRVTKLESLEELGNLEEIYLAHNGISKIEGLEKNVRLPMLCPTSLVFTSSLSPRSNYACSMSETTKYLV